MERRDLEIKNIDEFDKRLQRILKHTKTVIIPAVSNCYFFNDDPLAYPYIDYSGYDEKILWVKPSVLMWFIKEYLFESKIRNITKVAIFESWRTFVKDNKYTRGLDDVNPYFYFEVLETSEDGKTKKVAVWHDGVIAVVSATFDIEKLMRREKGAIILKSLDELLHLELSIARLCCHNA